MDRDGNSSHITRHELDDLMVLAQTSYEIISHSALRPTVTVMRGMTATLQDILFITLLTVTSSREFQRRRVAVRAMSLRERHHEMRRLWGEICRILREG